MIDERKDDEMKIKFIDYPIFQSFLAIISNTLLIIGNSNDLIQYNKSNLLYYNKIFNS